MLAMSFVITRISSKTSSTSFSFAQHDYGGSQKSASVFLPFLFEQLPDPLRRISFFRTCVQAESGVVLYGTYSGVQALKIVLEPQNNFREIRPKFLRHSSLNRKINLQAKPKFCESYRWSQNNEKTR
jgi:hypothetical protein